MVQFLGALAALVCGVYFIAAGLTHVRPQVFAGVGPVAVSGPQAQLAGGSVFALGLLLFLDDLLRGRASFALLMGAAAMAVGALWVRTRRIDLLAHQARPTRALGYCYLAIGLPAALFGLWSLLPA